MDKRWLVLNNITYEVVATVRDEDTNKDYVVYTDKHIDKNVGIRLYCDQYYEENGEIIPVKITSEEDKEVAKDVINEIMIKINQVVKN